MVDPTLLVDAGVFAPAVEWAARVLPSRPTIPILSGVVLEADSDGLMVSGFDYDSAATARIEVVGDWAGRVVVSGRLLAAVTKSLPARPVDLRVEGSRLVVTCGSITLGLPTMAAEDYPKLPQPPPPCGSVDGEAFRVAVARVAMCADHTGKLSLPVLAGVHLDLADELTLTATDRYRVGVDRLPWKPTGSSRTALVPAANMQIAAKALAGDIIDLAADEHLFAFTASGRTLIARQIAEKFPDIAHVMPDRSPTPAVVASAALLATVKRATMVQATDKIPAVMLAFTAGTLTVSGGGESADGEISETVDCDYTGKPVTVGAQPRFLLDAITAHSSPRIELSITGAGKAVLVLNPDQPVDGYQHTFVSLRTGKESRA